MKIRWKANQLPMLWDEQNNRLWTITPQYIRELDIASNNYQDWKEATVAHHKEWMALIEQVSNDKMLGSSVQFRGKEFQVTSDVRGFGTMGVDKLVTVDSTPGPPLRSARTEVADTTIEAAGRCASALETVIKLYHDRDPQRALKAVDRLMYIAGNVSWQSYDGRAAYIAEERALTDQWLKGRVKNDKGRVQETVQRPSDDGESSSSPGPTDSSGG
jgi:hypothetical protein